MDDVILDHELIARRYFFPHGRGLDDARTRVVETADGERLRCLVGGPSGAPCVVHFHGNGELAADHLDLASWLHARGLRTVLAEYRGYGGSSGVPALGSMLDDVAPILEACDVEPERAVVFGRSVGSIFAIEAARVRPGLAGLVLESGIADVHERIRLRVEPAEVGCTEEALREVVGRRCDHRGTLQSFAGRVLVLHTRHDHLVDVEHGERLARWARHGRAVIFERGDHNSIFAANREAYLTALGTFVDETLAS